MSDIEDSLMEMIKKSGALLEGHFMLSSGLHSGKYFQCALFLKHPEYAEWAGKELAKIFKDVDVDAVTAPALGGLIIGHEVARALGRPFLFCERKGPEGEMELHRFNVEPGMKFIVIEDVITTGGSVLAVKKHLEALGAQIWGVGCIVDRSSGRHFLPEDPACLMKMAFPTYRPEDCPHCKSGERLVKPGSKI